MLARKLMSGTQTIWEYHSVSSFSAIKVAGTLEQYNKCRITNNSDTLRITFYYQI